MDLKLLPDSFQRFANTNLNLALHTQRRLKKLIKQNTFARFLIFPQFFHERQSYQLRLFDYSLKLGLVVNFLRCLDTVFFLDQAFSSSFLTVCLLSD